MNEIKDPWHFSRPELAQAYLNGFNLGLTSARGLFALRRMGKSEFLKKDLLPAAVEAGYLTVYTNLWEDTEHPGQALASGIFLAAQPSALGRLWESLNTPITKLKGGGRTDRAVLLLAANGVQDLYSAPALKQLQELLDSPDVTASAPRTSLRRLTGSKLQLMAKIDHGTYRFEDAEFQAWVTSRRTVE